MKNVLKKALALALSVVMVMGALVLPISAGEPECKHDDITTLVYSYSKEATCKFPAYDCYECPSCGENVQIKRSSAVIAECFFVPKAQCSAQVLYFDRLEGTVVRVLAKNVVTQYEEGVDTNVRGLCCGTTESYCKWCGAPKVSHKLVPHDAVAATCTEAGNRKYYTCADCDFVGVEEEWENLESGFITEPPCAEPKTYIVPTTIDATVLEALDHSFDSDNTGVVEATCTDPGYEFVRCKRPGCTEIKITKDIPALGHLYYTNYNLTKCSDKIADAYKFTINLPSYPDVVSPVFGCGGTVSFNLCARCCCLDNIVVGNGFGATDSDVIVAAEAAVADFVSMVNPAVTDNYEILNGIAEYKDHTWFDQEETTVSYYPNPDNHVDYCSKTTLTYRVCKVCGYRQLVDTNVEVTHDWENFKVDADCCQAGYYYKKCKLCPEVEMGDVIPKLAHKNGSGEELGDDCTYLLTNPQFTDDFCVLCHKKIYVHDTKEDYVAPTGLKPGYKEEACVICKKQFFYEVCEPTHHSEEYGVCNCNSWKFDHVDDNGYVWVHCTYCEFNDVTGKTDYCPHTKIDYYYNFSRDLKIEIAKPKSCYLSNGDVLETRTADLLAENFLVKVPVYVSVDVDLRDCTRTGYDYSNFDKDTDGKKIIVKFTTLSFNFDYNPLLLSLYEDANHYHLISSNFFCDSHVGDDEHNVDASSGLTTARVVLDNNNSVTSLHNGDVIANVYFRLNDGSSKLTSSERTLKVSFDSKDKQLIDGRDYSHKVEAGTALSFNKIYELGDVNYDKSFDNYDLESMISLVKAGGYTTTADINKDGKVNAADYELLACYRASMIRYTDFMQEGTLVIDGLNYNGSKKI